MDRITTDILVIGGGPAGLSATAAAIENSDARIAIVDDNPCLGGQIWRAERGKTRSAEASVLIRHLASERVQHRFGTQVIGQTGSKELLIETPDGARRIGFAKLVIATGSRERFLPFPGWTLPNVFGAGGLQALVKGGMSVTGKRVLVAGTGPLLLAVADYLKSKGARILLIAEQARSADVLRFGIGLASHPKKVIQAAKLRARLTGVRYLTDCYVTRAEGVEKLERIELTRNGKKWIVECDHLACGFHLVPNVQLASLIGCSLVDSAVSVGEYQQTSVDGVYCAGEPTGIGGVEVAMIEGRIAGLAAVGKKHAAKKLFSARRKAQQFASRLNRAFELREELKGLPGDSTLICRCEDVEFGRVRECGSWRSAKLQTRCGMGPCQGQICGPAVEFLLSWNVDGVRPPLYPVSLQSLAEGDDNPNQGEENGN